MVSKAYVRRLLAEVRANGLNVVEGIVAWRRAVMTKDDEIERSNPSTPKALPPLQAKVSPQRPKPHVFFRWSDSNSLVKMLSDLNFICWVTS